MRTVGALRTEGRVLVVGGKQAASTLTDRLTQSGFLCAVADDGATLASSALSLRPEAVVFTAGLTDSAALLRKVRGDARLRPLPVLGDLSSGGAEALRALELDDLIHVPEELTRRIQSALQARRLVERDERSRQRMEALLEITQAATSTLELDQVLGLAVEKMGQIISSDRCSIILVEGSQARSARVVASREVPNFAPMALDLARYPELRRALETRSVVHVEDASRDPLLGEVRRHIQAIGVKSILVQPLVCQDDLMGALFFRMSRADGAFDREDREFAQAVAAALANSVRNARLHQALKRKREDLESAYVDRYRELSAANKRLKELNRLKDELIAVCSHDLRAPLNVLLGHGKLVLDDGPPEPQRSSVEAMVRQGRKILELVESLLERGRGEQGRLSIDARPVDISELGKEGASELEILAKQKKVSLRAETPESLLVIGDEVKLREVLQNLLTNALQHAREGGEVVVRCQRQRRPDGDAVRVVVQDDGPGIPRDQLHLVFDKYRHGPGGIGLGLAICREFIELHGGEIWAEAPESGGAAFVFTLPLARVEGQGARREPLAAESGELPRALVVEDEPEVAAQAAEILRTRFRVDVARDGAEGLAKARAQLPDIVVMDVFLPKLDGLDAVAALKGSQDTADIPVILLSAHQGVADKVRALDLGAVDYLAKPFQPLELLRGAERAVALRQTQRELERSQILLRRSGSDPETGLFDRVGFVLRLDQEIARSRRYGRPLCVALFKATLPLGSKVRSCAALIRGSMRLTDVIAHLGNGVFAILLPECELPAAQMLTQRLSPTLRDAAGVDFRTVAKSAAEGDLKGDAFLEALLGERPA